MLKENIKNIHKESTLPRMKIGVISTMLCTAGFVRVLPMKTATRPGRRLTKRGTTAISQGSIVEQLTIYAAYNSKS